MVENGRLARRSLSFGHRTMDGRLEVAGGLAEGARVVTRLVSGLAEGRSVRTHDASP